jgi:hypothetical protein
LDDGVEHGAFDCKFQLLSPTPTDHLCASITFESSFTRVPSLFTFTLDYKRKFATANARKYLGAPLAHHINPLSPYLLNLYHTHLLIPISHTLAHSPILKTNPPCPSTPPKMADIDGIVNMGATVGLARRELVDPPPESSVSTSSPVHGMESNAVSQPGNSSEAAGDPDNKLGAKQVRAH